MSVLFSLFGIVALLGCAFLLSESRSSINWKTVSRALLLQLGFAALVLYFPMGQAALASLSNGVAGLLSFADEGIRFLFGD
ncbi:na+ dependent nucleoside transporter family protein, partial [Vibrio parahaemolyticus AQ3810]